MKLCYECKMMGIEEAARGYSDRTPGCDFSMGCDKGHWDWHNEKYDMSRPKLADLLTTAETCPDYDADPEMIAIVKGD